MLRLVSVHKSYSDGPQSIQVLRGISCEVQSAELVTIVGRSGSGKSSFLNVSAGLDRPDSGEIWVGDKNIAQLSEEQRAAIRLHSIGIVFQFFNLLPTLTLQENIGIPLDLAKVKGPARTNRVEELLGLVGLTSAARRYPHEASGGEIQRAAIARALANRPMLLLADEPTGNLDWENSANILSLIKNLVEIEKVAAVVVTHDEALFAGAGRRLLLDQGSFVQPQAIRE